jgi:alpha-galactosidase
VNPGESGYCLWIVVSEDKSEAILGYFQILAKPNPVPERYKLKGLDDNSLYTVQNRPQYVDVRQFGDLIHSFVPVSPVPEDYLLELETTEFSAYGDQLMNRGFVPKSQFYGTGLNSNNAFVGDFGSRLFVLTKND